MIAIYTPVHTRVDLAYDQITNYTSIFGSKGKIFIHLSCEAREKFFKEYKSIENVFENVEIVSKSFKTSGNCIFGAFFACTEHVFEKYPSDYFTHVYLHSDSDLVFSKKIYDYIVSNNIGFGRAPVPNIEKDKWMHNPAMLNDKKFLRFLNDHGLSGKDTWRGRQEGSFFDMFSWKKIFSYLEFFLPWDDYYTGLRKEWPFEEVVIPTICRGLLDLSFSVDNVIYSKPVQFKGENENPANTITEVELKKILNNNPNYFGAKRWPLEMNCKVRKLLRSSLLGEKFIDAEFPWVDVPREVVYFYENISLDRKVEKEISVFSFIEKRVKAESKSPDILREVAFSFEEVGDIKTALKLMQKSLELLPSQPVVKQKVDTYTKYLQKEGR